MGNTVTGQAAMDAVREGERTVLRLSGDLNVETTSPLWRTADAQVNAAAAGPVTIDLAGVLSVDSAGAALVIFLRRRLEGMGRQVEVVGASAPVASLLGLVDRAEPVAATTAEHHEAHGRVERVGELALLMAWNVRATVAYMGALLRGLTLSFFRPRTVRWGDVFKNMTRTGADAIGIVMLINFLMGVILAFQMADQLHTYGADIYLADVIGLSIAMELGPLMTAIVLAGRSGASFAAEIGTMKVNEEVDALDTMGLDRTRFLVMPKVLALLFAMPLLVVFGVLCGIAGGVVIGVGSVGLPLGVYLSRTQEAITLWEGSQGFIKGEAYALVISAVSCLRGLQTRTGAEGVGLSTTSAVVSGILLIILTDAALTLVFHYV